MRFGIVIAMMLSVSSIARAEETVNLPIFPLEGGQLSGCPPQWWVDSGGKGQLRDAICAVPVSVWRCWRRPDRDNTGQDCIWHGEKP